MEQRRAAQPALAHRWVPPPPPPPPMDINTYHDAYHTKEEGRRQGCQSDGQLGFSRSALLCAGGPASRRTGQQTAHAPRAMPELPSKSVSSMTTKRVIYIITGQVQPLWKAR
jgi:hypothetical protein